MDYYLELGDEYDFAWSFDSPEDVFYYLIELHNIYDLSDIRGIKQAFLNQELHFHYMECVRFEETYLRHD